jgi:8-oxo-dGTP pyrophosphatase MutT (NUDIX family)
MYIFLEADVVPTDVPIYKQLFKVDWLSVHRGIHDGKLHVHTTADSVCILPYRRIGKDAWEYLLRCETPASYRSGGTSLTSITGTLENGVDPAKHAAVELHEEAGLKLPVSQFKYHGVTIPSKLVTTRVHLFSVPVAMSNSEMKAAKGDGSIDEKIGYCVWVSNDTMRNKCLCPLPELISHRAGV